jgi:hypothetical protein
MRVYFRDKGRTEHRAMKILYVETGGGRLELGAHDAREKDIGIRRVSDF